ncbi:hypothetical protein QUF88_15920 [Bacillus sp. DX1.1]|uniref:hypothetical protein n=1 Tax=unclassified Bacillus (in: firmicutes) TaxID=185979 RepID=UPI0025706352|nr:MULTISPECIES: hypothetical protein [unclassified Bacillus (in: firmicutes)]MDM5155240.1 hypothetical protein [Bacillus sp. DX1.1]WJE79560.1 hypothetical protein QRE67_13420 [Bacillus sp. DX3.1]
MIQQFFKKMLGQFLQRHEEEILGKVCFWIVYYFIKTPRYVVNHSDDSPWKYSGRLINTNQSHEEHMYNTIEDFLNEYSGETRGSSCSGIGLFHIKIEESIREKCLHIIYSNYLNSFVKQHSLLCKEMLIEVGANETEIESADYETVMVYDCGEIEEYLYVLEDRIINQLFTYSMSYIIYKYNGEVRAFIEGEERKRNAEAKAFRLEQQYAHDLWDRIQKEYKLKCRKNLSRVETRQYKVFQKFLIEIGITPIEQALLGKHLSHAFSNSVQQQLMNISKEVYH